MRLTTRAALSAAVAVVGIGLLAGQAAAQEVAARRIELRPFVGAYIPTGDQRDELKDAFALGTTLAYRVTPALSIVGNFGWSPSEAKATSAAAADDNDLDLFQYDAGVELGRDFSLGASAWTWRPFIGIGAGARTYSFRDRDVDAETDFAGYGAAGVQFDAGRFGLRLEARDYLSSFDGLDGKLSDSSTRNDLFLAGALSIRF
ncbi:MAG: outer membrane beta-barrel protein [bacterium]|jgi:hypothetical protein|nr:MAG: hypothetical protein DIU52_10670 [bacterium]